MFLMFFSQSADILVNGNMANQKGNPVCVYMYITSITAAAVATTSSMHLHSLITSDGGIRLITS